MASSLVRRGASLLVLSVVLLTNTRLGSIFQLEEKEVNLPAEEAGQGERRQLDNPPAATKGGEAEVLLSVARIANGRNCTSECSA